jgi:hypothetical protein
MSQNQSILSYLKQGNTLTAIEALNLFNCFRCAARINDLINMGHKIESKITHSNGKKWAVYSMGEL